MSEPLALIWPVADLRATLAAALPGATVEVCPASTPPTPS
jgi:hypothetical protein